MQEALEWRQVAETNGNLMRRYEESRADLEKALRVGQACLKERGEPDELFRKHNVRQQCLTLQTYLTCPVSLIKCVIICSGVLWATGPTHFECLFKGV